MMDSSIQMITFSIGDEEFGVEILKIKEIIRMARITKVPRSYEFVEGIINLRDRLYPL
jgi:purine-binding chemotaxis protein CheW